jgi:uncharacterized metal-binding protein YceD (DUF177 family)
MRIRISTISPKGLNVKDSLSLELLNARMNEGRENDIFFTEAPRVDLTVFKTASGAETKGKVKTRFKQPCSRCLDVIERDLEIDTNFILQPLPEDQTREGGSYEDDVGIIWYEGDRVDLEDAIQEALILSLSLYWRPPVDESGRCTLCGLSLEAGDDSDCAGSNNLGNLLRRAGIN